jgi:ribitol 2-dehydrogenase
MAISLSGKVAIITGASSGIGAATARELVKQGCKVALVARSADRLQALARELGPSALAIPADVVSGKDVERMASATVDRFGRIDVLFANAGVYLPGQFADGDPEAFAKLIDINVTGVIRTVRAVLPQMRKQKSGDILVTSSISGVIDIHWEPVYSASKHAVQGLVHTVRRQVMGEGIRVAAICPGMVANELWGITDPAAIDKHVRERTALTSEDVVDGVVFMLTRPANVTIRDLVMFPANQDL